MQTESINNLDMINEERVTVEIERDEVEEKEYINRLWIMKARKGCVLP